MYFPFDSWWEREKKKQRLHFLLSDCNQQSKNKQEARSGVPTWLDPSQQWDPKGSDLALLDAAMLSVRVLQRCDWWTKTKYEKCSLISFDYNENSDHNHQPRALIPRTHEKVEREKWLHTIVLRSPHGHPHPHQTHAQWWNKNTLNVIFLLTLWEFSSIYMISIHPLTPPRSIPLPSPIFMSSLFYFLITHFPSQGYYCFDETLQPKAT